MVMLVLTLKWGDWTGATAAACAFMVGRLGGNIFLLPGLKAKPATQSES